MEVKRKVSAGVIMGSGRGEKERENEGEDESGRKQ